MVLGRHVNLLPWWHRIGWAGVDLFFVLSGFLVGGLLFEEYARFGSLSVRRFYLRRGLKIWPAFYALLAVGFVIGPRPRLPEIAFLQNYFIPPIERAHEWSLAVEEHFYLALPLLLLAIRGDRHKPFAAMPGVFAAAAVFGLIWRFTTGWNMAGDSYRALPRVVFETQARMDGLMFGALLAYWRVFRPAIFGRIAGFRLTWLVAIAAIVLLIRYDIAERPMRTWGLTAVYLAAGLIIAKAFTATGPRAIQFGSGVLARIGIYSYSIYLWHLLFLTRIAPRIPECGPLASITGAIMLGIVMAKLIEIPMLAVRERIVPARPRGMIATA